MTHPRPRAVVIGASAGALEALSTILPTLPATFALPVMVVVHVPPEKRSLMAELLRSKCSIPVLEVEDKDFLKDGVIYVAPPDYHSLVESDGSISLSIEAPVLYSRPSIDVLFESAAEAYGSTLIGIVLTGANHDGAKGLRAVADAGGTAVVQDPHTAFAPAMPEAAISLCPEALVLSLAGIASFLQEV